MFRRLRIPAAIVVLPSLAYFGGLYFGMYGELERPGKPAGSPVPDEVVASRTATRIDAAHAIDEPDTKQILFGDLHVHTTFSLDAFRGSLPLVQGEGSHPPADACDFARFCSALDFWALTDHAESLTPDKWEETKAAVRECNAVAGDPANPDLVSFLGWEWSQVGPTPETHYGHKNVIFMDTADDKVPARPIGATGELMEDVRPSPVGKRVGLVLADFPNRQRSYDLDRFTREIAAVPACQPHVNVRELPLDCMEGAATPADLYEKLDEWGFDTVVIPHATTWGLYTPPGATLDNQLNVRQHDPARQLLFEIYSGHGSSEEYRSWRAVRIDADGKPYCPPPGADYTPTCWRAGEIVRERCLQAGLAGDECEKRAAEARENVVNAGIPGFRTVPGASIEDWLDAGQCRDCFQPAMNYRPASSAQYALALTNFDDPGHPLRFRFGFVGSSDNHSARPGTGYKEFARHGMTETHGAASRRLVERSKAIGGAPEPRSIPFDPKTTTLSGIQLTEMERNASFFLTGGLVAVHSAGRSREQVWAALKRKEVYGTSGPRILLWFDLLNAPGTDADEARVPMGSETAMNVVPHFQVRAAGAFKQKPGCPDYAVNALTPERLEKLCKAECYNPSDERELITRLEVIRIRPRMRADEPIDPLIEDPWKRFDCPPSPDGCTLDFEDPEFIDAARDTVYYVRAIQAPTPTVNGGGLRCEYDEKGNCIKVNPCYGDIRTDPKDDCLAPSEQRAWSSPIFVDFKRN